jgi:hypothetical protein
MTIPRSALRPSIHFLILNMQSSSPDRRWYPLLSMPRFVLPLPMYILLARAGEVSSLAPAIVYSWLALLLFFSAQFALGGWVA